MTTTLVDSNVLLDYLNNEDEWFDWSQSMIRDSAEIGAIAINPVIYAEVSMGYETIEDFEAALPREFFLRLPIPWEAAFLAAKCFKTYRRRGGTKRSPLPDFFIGAHAAISGLTLLTRDARRYRAYFPKLKILAP